MGNYSPNQTPPTQTDAKGFTRTSVLDFNAAELLVQVIVQLKLISMKLDCLQADGDVIDDNEIDTLELQ